MVVVGSVQAASCSSLAEPATVVRQQSADVLRSRRGHVLLAAGTSQ